MSQHIISFDSLTITNTKPVEADFHISSTTLHSAMMEGLNNLHLQKLQVAYCDQSEEYENQWIAQLQNRSEEKAALPPVL